MMVSGKDADEFGRHLDGEKYRDQTDRTTITHGVDQRARLDEIERREDREGDRSACGVAVPCS
jgi:hypothetical protein